MMCLTLLITFVAGSSTWASTEVKYAPGQVVLQVQLNVTLTQNSDYTLTASDSKLQAVLDEIHACWFTKEFATAKVGSQLQRIYTIYMPESEDVIDAVTKLSALDCIQLAQPNYVFTASAVPSDKSYSDEWGLSKINAPTAWDLFTGSSSVVVAILDSGVDLTHQDLEDNIWINTGEIAGNGIDDDNNGFIDDVYGWDFVSFPKFSISIDDDGNITHGAGVWKPEDNNPGEDANDPILAHGTHVAGIVGAVANNTVSGEYNVAGTLWNCQLMPVRSGNLTVDEYGNETSSFTATAIAKGLYYATENGAQVINMSFGGYSASNCSVYARSIRYAHEQGVVLCAAAGNDDVFTPAYPASLDNVISVAATDKNDKKAYFSNYGDTVDISAPGVDILSTVLDDKYAEYSGTSMACPFVSGAAGLILGYGEQLGKTFTPGQVEAILKDSADNIDTENPNYQGYLGAGRLNIGNALTLAQNSYPMVSSIQVTTAGGDDTPTVLEYGSINLIATAVYSNGQTEDVTDEVTWSVRPVRYGYFCSYEAGKYFALQVTDNREVTVTATYTINGDISYGQCVMTIQNDPEASPLVITGSDAINPSASASYTATYTIADDEDINVTAEAKWEIISGNQYANFDSSQPGVLTTLSTAAGKNLVIQATYIDEDNRLSFVKTYTIHVNSESQQIAGLYLTAPDEIAAGSTLELTAKLVMTGTSSTQDVTANSDWSVSPTSAGSFSEAGTFVAGNVTSKTTATITCDYTQNGTTYTAEIDISIIPAVASSETVTDTDTDTGDSEDDTTTEIQSLFDSLTSCPIAGILTIALMFSGLLILIREN
jgi:subtilisin family serine protease